MKVLTLDQIKSQLRIELDDVHEDAHLTLLGTAAEGYAVNYIGRPIPWLEDGVLVECPAPLIGAMLMIVADLYVNREGSLVGGRFERNPAVAQILDQYRVGFGV